MRNLRSGTDDGRRDDSRSLRRVALALVAACALLGAAPHPSASALLRAGYAFERAGRTTDAIASFDAAIAADPRSTLAYQARGFALLQRNEPRRALRDLDRAARLPGADVAQIAFGRGDAYARLGERRAALAAYDASIARNPLFMIAFEHRAATQLALGNAAAAIRDATTALDFSRADAIAWNIRGWAYAKRNDNARALHDLDSAIALVPRFVAARRNRAVVRERLGERDAAEGDRVAAQRVLDQRAAYAYLGRWPAALAIDEPSEPRPPDRRVRLDRPPASALTTLVPEPLQLPVLCAELPAKSEETDDRIARDASELFAQVRPVADARQIDDVLILVERRGIADAFVFVRGIDAWERDAPATLVDALLQSELTGFEDSQPTRGKAPDDSPGSAKGASAAAARETRRAPLSPTNDR